MNNLNIFLRSARGTISKSKNKLNNVINYFDVLQKNSRYIYDPSVMQNGSATRLENCLKDSFVLVNNKDFIKDNPEFIKECFEISCYILYDRQILNEVIEKQKKYETDYIADFLKYILRIFLKRYDNETILTKNQCYDIRKLCSKLLANSKYYNECNLINRISAKEIVGILRNIAI